MTIQRGSTASEEETVLIIAKTYPLPSKKYQETSCVAGINSNGYLRRVYPVPFRLLSGEKQFSRWQWVTAQFYPSTKDIRPESRRIDADSIQLGAKIGTKNNWYDRLVHVEPHLVFSFAELEERRQQTQQTLGFLRPTRLLGLDITPLPLPERQWSSQERESITQDFAQPDLFNENAKSSRPMLEKVPYHFHYRYQMQTANGAEEARHMITDWEVGQLYRNCCRSHGGNWEKPFRAKLEADFSQKPLVFMMGNQHRFPDQWLIIGIIYPPRHEEKPAVVQSVLELGT